MGTRRVREGGAGVGEVADASALANETAIALLQLDVETGSVHVEGLLGPGSQEWNAPGGARAYVRSE
ncbi:hypothetical protein [Streptomyces jumonjinensis]|uniref:hypothetical protein n=1 Tax=Streptomyces jumonjinensis TaxID=1945 RepID=UPI0037AE086D